MPDASKKDETPVSNPANATTCCLGKWKDTVALCKLHYGLIVLVLLQQTFTYKRYEELKRELDDLNKKKKEANLQLASIVNLGLSRHSSRLVLYSSSSFPSMTCRLVLNEISITLRGLIYQRQFIMAET